LNSKFNYAEKIPKLSGLFRRNSVKSKSNLENRQFYDALAKPMADSFERVSHGLFYANNS
jgi:hypothetical protein